MLVRLVLWNYRGGVNSSCATGYKDLLCNVCDEDSHEGLFAKVSDNSCQACKPLIIQLVKLFSAIAILGVYVTYII